MSRPGPAREPARDEGLTVVELAVTSMVMLIVLTMLFAMVASMQRAAGGAELRLRKLEDARLVAQVLTRDLRTVERDPASVPTQPLANILTASATQATFYGNLTPDPARDNLPDLISLTVTGTGARRTLTETVTPPVRNASNQWVRATTTTTESRSRVLTAGLATPSGSVLFEYWPATGITPLNSAASPDVAAASRGAIAYVRLDISIQTPTTLGTPPTTLRTEVRLPNVTVRPES